MKIFEYRDGARNQHRSIALLAVIQCWVRGWDGAVIKRLDLERILSLQKFKQERLEWLIEDFSSYFPHSRLIYATIQVAPTFQFFCVSRKNIDFLNEGDFDSWPITVEKAAAGGVHVGMLEIPKTRTALNAIGVDQALPFLRAGTNYYESVISAYLLLLSQGKIPPESLNTQD